MEEKILQIIVETLNVDASRITKDTVIADVLEWDSMMFLMIISSLNEKLNITIPIDEATNIKTVSDIFKFA